MLVSCLQIEPVKADADLIVFPASLSCGQEVSLLVPFSERPDLQRIIGKDFAPVNFIHCQAQARSLKLKINH